MSRVETMFGPRENWGQGDEMGVVRERAVRQEGGGTRLPEKKGQVRSGEPEGQNIPNGPGQAAEAAGVPAEKPKAVKGFVSIKCGECGKVTSTCLHEAREIFVCTECGHPTPLENLKIIRMDCPRCHFKARYQTNRTERKIQMECLNCSKPVNLRQGFRRGNYVPEEVQV